MQHEKTKALVLTLEVRSAQREAVTTAFVRTTKGQDKHAKLTCLTVKHLLTVESGRLRPDRACGCSCDTFGVECLFSKTKPTSKDQH
jgi:hypothetical protein